MYDLAKHLTEERIRQANHKRLTSHLRQLQAEASNSSATTNPPNSGSWTMEWTTNGLAGGRVSFSNPATGKRFTGRHPFDWDRALTRAIHGSN